MKKVLLSVAVLMVSCVAFGQTKAVKEAKRQADAKKFAEAEQLINGALTNDETKNDANTWNVAGYIQQKINEDENTKAYLKQAFDTVKMYNSTFKMFEYFNKCDELEQIPNEKGKIKIKFRKNNAATLKQNRPNLINGGVFYFNQGKDAASDNDSVMKLRAATFAYRLVCGRSLVYGERTGQKREPSRPRYAAGSLFNRRIHARRKLDGYQRHCRQARHVPAEVPQPAQGTPDPPPARGR